MQPSSVTSLLSAVRVFFEYMVRQGHYEQNPVGNIPQLKKNVIVPFIFTPEQTNQLLAAVCKRFHHTKRLFLSKPGHLYGDIAHGPVRAENLGAFKA